MGNYSMDKIRNICFTGHGRAGKTTLCEAILFHAGAIDRFGKKDVQYSKSDDRHFTVTAKVEISKQFFGWLLGFGKEVKIISPEEVKEEFAAYIDKIRDMY